MSATQEVHKRRVNKIHGSKAFVDKALPDNKTLNAKCNTIETSSLVSTHDILRSINELIYSWELHHDRLHWNGDPVKVLEVTSLGQVATGSAFHKLSRTGLSESRYDAVFNSGKIDTGAGVDFKIRYAIEPALNRIIWVEDKGRWFGDDSGAPYLVHGSIRVIAAPAFLSETSISNSDGVLSRNDLQIALQNAVSNAETDSHQTALIMAGVEDLGRINRTYGFDRADEAINVIAMRLKGALRAGDEIGRYSGNKLAIILKNCTKDDLNIAALRFLDIVRSGAIETRHGSVITSLKLGAAISSESNKTDVNLLQCAEDALSCVKKRQDLNYLCFSPDQPVYDQQQAHLRETDLIVGALNDRRIMLAYQPIANAKTRKVEYHEGLVRMQLPDGKIGGAGQIVPPAERAGLLKYIDLRVIELAVSALTKDPDLYLSINVDVPSMLNSDWIDTLSANLVANQVDAGRIIVEITETAMIKDLATTTKVIEALHLMGVKIALDDFGAGHTSFKTLRNMPIDIVKIDGVFTENLKSSADDKFFVSTLISLAKHLGMKTVAEWVRDRETADILTDMGIDYLQGDFVGEASVDADLLQNVTQDNNHNALKNNHKKITPPSKWVALATHRKQAVSAIQLSLSS